MEKKLKVSDFAGLVGTSQKTIYERINNSSNLPVSEQLISVIEKVRGREVRFICTTDEQILHYQKIFSPERVNEGKYEDILTFSEPQETYIEVQEPSRPSDSGESLREVIEQIVTLSNDYNNKLMAVNEELINYKSKTLLLEDKAGREGLYLNEINTLKQSQAKLMKIIYSLITLFIIILLAFTSYLTYNIAVGSMEEGAAQEVGTALEMGAAQEEQATTAQNRGPKGEDKTLVKVKSGPKPARK